MEDEKLSTDCLTELQLGIVNGFCDESKLTNVLSNKLSKYNEIKGKLKRSEYESIEYLKALNELTYQKNDIIIYLSEHGY